MARKESITKQMIIDGAFELLKKEGVEAVTARKLAAHIGCSTQPIFRVYENMMSFLRNCLRDQGRIMRISATVIRTVMILLL